MVKFRVIWAKEGPVSSAGLQLTQYLKAWSGGDPSALEQLTPIVYGELYRLASRKLAGMGRRDVLQPSALVNEAFVRLLTGKPVDWTSRTHFFAHSAVLMRRILIDFARAQKAVKRSPREAAPFLSDIWEGGSVPPVPVDFLDLDLALNELGQIDERLSRVVELRYFGGLDNGEVAQMLGVSEPTVIRDWRTARAWLLSRLVPPQTVRSTLSD